MSQSRLLQVTQSAYFIGGGPPIPPLNLKKVPFNQIASKPCDSSIKSARTIEYMESKRKAGEYCLSSRNQYVINISENGEKASLMTSGDIQTQRQNQSLSVTNSFHLKDTYKPQKEGSLLAQSSREHLQTHRKLDLYQIISPSPSSCQLNQNEKLKTSFKSFQSKDSSERQRIKQNHQIQLNNLQQRYYTQMKQNCIVADKFFDKGCFEGLVNSFAINDILLLEEPNSEMLIDKSDISTLQTGGDKSNMSILPDEIQHLEQKNCCIKMR